MKVISAPHPTLRRVAQTITKFDKRFFKFVDRLKAQMLKEKDPEGVGLAAPQVNKSWQVFVARVGEDLRASSETRAFINPKIIAHAPKKTLLDDSAHFEGCLSVPLVYGPVPRWDWIEMKYQTIEAGKIVERQEKFADFPARVLQHEYDHLQGVLFTDYLLELNLPAYISKNNEWIELEDRSMVESF